MNGTNTTPAPKCRMCGGAGVVKQGNTERRCPRCGGKGVSGPIHK